MSEHRPVPVPEPLAPGGAPPDRYCDLVLTGGVASGVVYPWALLELARAFRFKSIGGTSVGAMAAALAAAAEYGRSKGGLQGFEVLRQMPLALAEEDEHGDTVLLRLFKPAPTTARLFRLFIGALKRNAREQKAGFGRRSASLLGHALWLYLKLAVLLPLAAGWIVVWLSGDGWAAAGAAAIAALALLLVAMLRFYRDLAVHMVKNQHGVCKGLERRVAASERAALGRTRRNG